MANDCRKKACCQVSDKILGDLSGFSFVGGDFPGGSINGNPESSFLVECPEGFSCEPGTYPIVVTIPKNTNISPYGNAPDGLPITVSVPCGDGTTLSKTFPAGTSQEDLNAAYYELFQQCGQSMADQQVNKAAIATLYTSSDIGVDCNGLSFNGSPGGLIVWDDANKIALLPGGAFASYNSQAAADALAAQYIMDQVAAAIAAGVQCGYWNTEQIVICGDSTEIIVPANSYFSSVSQTAADNEAIAYGLSQCGTCESCNDEVAALTWACDTCDPGGSSEGATFEGAGGCISWSMLANQTMQTKATGILTQKTCRVTGTVTVDGPGVALVFLGAGFGYTGLATGPLTAGTYAIDESIDVANGFFGFGLEVQESAGTTCEGSLVIGPGCMPDIDSSFNWTVTTDNTASGGGSTTYDSIGRGPLSCVTVTDAKVGSPAFPFVSQTEITTGVIPMTSTGNCKVTVVVTSNTGTTSDNYLRAIVKVDGFEVESHTQSAVGTGTVEFSHVAGETVEIILSSTAGLYDDAVTVSYGEIHGSFTVGNLV